MGNAVAMNIDYVRRFWARTEQLRSREIMESWAARGVDASTGGQWAARGFLPGETDSMRAAGVTPQDYGTVDAVWEEHPRATVADLVRMTGVPADKVAAIVKGPTWTTGKGWS